MNAPLKLDQLVLAVDNFYSKEVLITITKKENQELLDWIENNTISVTSIEYQSFEPKFQSVRTIVYLGVTIHLNVV